MFTAGLDDLLMILEVFSNLYDSMNTQEPRELSQGESTALKGVSVKHAPTTNPTSMPSPRVS